MRKGIRPLFHGVGKIPSQHRTTGYKPFFSGVNHMNKHTEHSHDASDRPSRSEQGKGCRIYVYFSLLNSRMMNVEA